MIELRKIIAAILVLTFTVTSIPVTERHCERSEALSKEDCFVPPVAGLAMTKLAPQSRFADQKTRRAFRERVKKVVAAFAKAVGISGSKQTIIEGIPLDEYIAFMDLYRSETDAAKRAKFDISGIIADPKEVVKRMRRFHAVKPKRIDTLITRQSTETPFQSIAELISNALDATLKNKRPIGRFGVGGLQVLSYLLDSENPGFEEGDQVIVDTKPEDPSHALAAQAHRVVFFKGRDGRIHFRIEASTRTEKGTTVSLKWRQGKSKKFLENMEAFLRSKFSLSTKMPVYLNGTLLNKLQDYIYLDGGYLKYQSPADRVEITIGEGGVSVKDHGEGMDLNKLLTTYLIPREGRGIPKDIPTEDEVGQEVAFFYKAPQGDEHAKGTMLVKLQVSGVQIQSFEIEGLGLPEELVLELPSLSHLNLARNQVEIDEVTLTAVKVFVRKLATKSPLHQDALVNGFLAAVRWMDKNNRKINPTRPLLDIARDGLSGWVSRQEGLILPNEEGFHEVSTEGPARFLDPALLVGLHPSRIPGTTRLINGEDFEPGTCLEAYTVPFKAGSNKSYVILGNYLLINKAIYEKHKEWPVFLNLRLNFYIGYGRRDPPKGRFLSLQEKAQAKAEAEAKKKVEGEAKFNLSEYEERFSKIKMLLPEQRRDLQDDIDRIQFEDETGLLEYLAHLSNWLSAIPDVLLSYVAIGYVSVNPPKGFLNAPLPDSALLDKHLSFFGEPKRLKHCLSDYLDNLVYNRTPALTLKEEPLKFLSFIFLTFASPQPTVDTRAGIVYPWSWIDDELLIEFNQALIELEADSKAFDREDLEMWEKFFEGVNKAAPYLKTKDDFQRFLIRYLRLFCYDREHPERFMELLDKQAKREIKEEVKNNILVDRDSDKYDNTIRKKLLLLNDGRLAILNSGSNSISIIDPQTKREVKNICNIGLEYPYTFALINDKDLAVVNHGGSIIILDTHTGTVVKRIAGVGLKQPEGIVRLIDGNIAVLNYWNEGFISIINPKTGELVKELKQIDLYFPFNLLLLKNGYLVTSSSGSVSIIDPQAGKEQKRLEEMNVTLHAAVALNNGDLAIVTGNSDSYLIRIINPQTGEVIKKIEGYGHPACLASFEDKYLAITHHGEDWITIISLKTFEVIKEIRGTGLISPQEIVFLNERSVAVVDRRTDGRLVNIVELGELPKTKPGRDYSSVRDFKPINLGDALSLSKQTHKKRLTLDDGVLVEFDGEDMSIRIIDTKTGREINKIKMKDINRVKPQIYSEKVAGIMLLKDGNLAVLCEGLENDVTPIHIDELTGEIIERDWDNIKNDPKYDPQASNTWDCVLIEFEGLAPVNTGGLDYAKVKNTKVINSSVFAETIIGTRGIVPHSIYLELDSDNSAILKSDGRSVSIINSQTGETINTVSLAGQEKKAEGINILKDGSLAVFYNTQQPDAFVVIFEFEEAAPDKGAKPKAKPQKRIRTGFEALNAADDLSGFPPLTRNIIRFLRDENVEFLEEKPIEEAQADWELVGEVNELEVARLNLIFDRFSNEITSEGAEIRGLPIERFKKMAQDAQGANVEHYSRKVTSAVAGQDTSQRVWVREVGIQNPRDAIRSARRNGLMKEGEIDHQNFLNNENWVYSMKDPVGMSLWQLVRYFFPLDESSKIKSWQRGETAGFFGQGVYTLFADFDEAFIRTSPSDPKDPGYGLINELVIKNDPQKGPTITSWRVYKGSYKGTEVRRIKHQNTSDPILESIFIQDALEQYAGAIKDVNITYNGKSPQEEMEVVAEVKAEAKGKQIIRLLRSKDKPYERVTVDEIKVKNPDKKEKKFVSDKIWRLLSQYGALQIELPANTPLNIPRNDYIGELSLPVMHLALKALLKDHVEKGTELPGYPEDYFSNEIVRDDVATQDIARCLNEGRYDDVDPIELNEHLSDEKELFELLTYINFTLSNGKNATLNEIREINLKELRMAKREALRGAVSRSVEGITEGIELSNNFSARLKKADWFTSGKLHGLRVGHVDPRGILDTIPPSAREAWEKLAEDMLRTIGILNPRLGYYHLEEHSYAHGRGSSVEWNLYHAKGDLMRLAEFLSEENVSPEEWQDWLYEYTQTVVHESQHCYPFETGGGHTHHHDDVLAEGFRMRMGVAIDRLLFDMASPAERMQELHRRYHIEPAAGKGSDAIENRAGTRNGS